MLLSLRNRLIVSLYPTYITIVRIGRGWRSQVAKEETLVFDPIPDQLEWQAPVMALKDWLKQHGHSFGEMRCILSDRFVRYALIPWAENVHKPAELEIFARINFEAVLGSANDDWIIKVDRSEYGRPAVASALNPGLLDALYSVAKENRISLSSIQPHFVQAFNRFRQNLNSEALFAVLDGGQCIVATFKDNAWHSMRALKLESTNPENALQTLIEREMLLQGLDEKMTAYVYSSVLLNNEQLGERITVLTDSILPTNVDDKNKPSVTAGAQ